jgi:hypothetical protein
MWIYYTSIKLEFKAKTNYEGEPTMCERAMTKEERIREAKAREAKFTVIKNKIDVVFRQCYEGLIPDVECFNKVIYISADFLKEFDSV